MKIDQKSLLSPDAAAPLAKLGGALRAHRLALRLTHDSVAALCQVSRQTLSRIERGDPSVAVGQVVRYAQVLGVSEELFGLGLPQTVSTGARRVRLSRSERQARGESATA